MFSNLAYHCFNYGRFFIPGGYIMGLLFLLVIGLAAFFIIKALNKKNESNSAIDILKKRYAAGEISKEEFDNMKKTLL